MGVLVSTNWLGISGDSHFSEDGTYGTAGTVQWFSSGDSWSLRIPFGLGSCYYSECWRYGIFKTGTVVTLVATPAEGWIFDGWLGVCSGTGVCTVTAGGVQGVGSDFTKIGFDPQL